MNDRNLLLSYLSILLVLLAIVAFFVVKQVLKTRRTESTLSRLQNKLGQGKGEAKEHYELGGILLDKKLYSQAIAQFQKGLKAKDLDGDENKALLLNALGYSYAAQEQYDLAMKHYKEAIELIPDYTTALNNLGFAYEKKQLSSQALESYEAALEIDPKSKTAKRRVEALRKRVTVSS
jgi:tetratricopeptide (TPR) repeat protein